MWGEECTRNRVPRSRQRISFGLGSHDDTPSTTSGLGIEAAGATVREAFFGYGGPWPAAIRFTMTLHDPRGVLEGGRTFQFVVNLGYARVYGAE